MDCGLLPEQAVAVLACKVPLPPSVVLLRRGLEATGPSGSVGGVTNHSTLLPNTGHAGGAGSRLVTTRPGHL